MKLLLKTNPILLCLLLCLFSSVNAQNIPKPIYPPRLVNDFAAIFSSQDRDALEAKLLAYNDSTSTQIYVVTVADLDGYDVSEYATNLGLEWKIGQKGKDNGMVILIKPQSENGKGRVFISVGYGLEAKINDGYAGRIIREVMIPYFRDNDYFGGVDAAVNKIIARLSGEFDADNEEEEGYSFGELLLIGFIALSIFLLFAYLGKGDQHVRNRRRNHDDWWGGSGGFGGGSSWGGGSGGGFSGGGGGSFGGGGAGGSW